MSARAGTGTLLKLALRRDRIMIPSWVYALTALSVGSAFSVVRLYRHDIAAGRAFALSVNKNPGLLMLYGPVHDPDSLGELSILKTNGTGAILVALMSLLLVVRHTRADEETGRTELVGAGVVGRSAALTAALLTALIANATLSVLSIVGLILAGLPTAGSVALGLAWFAIGTMFAGVAAVAAQLTESARAANGLSIAFLALTYLLRGLGDVSRQGPTWLTWLSPFGWTRHVRPYAGERWWTLALALAFVVVSVAVAYALVGRRDLGAGMIAARLGPATAAASLRGPVALAWRLQRGTLLAWAAGFAFYGALFGGVLKEVGGFVGDSSSMRDIISRMGGHQGIVDAFVATAMGVMALVASGYAVQAVLRLRAEESAGRAEPLLATRVGRVGWATGHLLFAALGPVLLLAVEGLAMGLVHGARTHDVSGQVPHIMAAAMVQVPAVWVLTGIAALFFGCVPRYAAAVWGVLGLFLILGQLGPLLRLKQWAMDVSPFTHVPKLPGHAVQVTPVAWLLAVAVALTAAGLVGFRRRDIG